MRGTHELRTRDEMEERVETHANEMTEVETRIEQVVGDIDTLRDLIVKLNLAGSAEGVAQVEQHVESSEHLTEDAFEREDENQGS